MSAEPGGLYSVLAVLDLACSLLAAQTGIGSVLAGQVGLGQV